MNLYNIFPFVNQFINEFQKIFQNKYNFNSSLEELHTLLRSDKISDLDKDYHSSIKTLGKDDRFSIFIQDYHNYVDNDTSFNNIYHNFLIKYVKPLFPEEEYLVIQKTPNLRISFPSSTAIGKNENEIDDIIGLHKDSDFGHHHSEINFIIPITEMFDTNSVYFEPEIGSNISYENYHNLKLKIDQFFIGKLNQLKHFNRINKTNKTRISLDLRVIPYSRYLENLKDFQGTKFEIDNYYIVI